MTTGGVSCAMKDCNFTSRNSKKSFFRFPKNTERSQLWVQACDNTNLLKLDTMQLYRSFRVCGSHFTPIMFLNDLKNRLHSHAVPEEIAEEIEFVSVSNSYELESIQEPKLEILHNCDSEENVQRTKRLQIEESVKRKDLPEQRIKEEEISTELLYSYSPNKRRIRQKINILRSGGQRLKLETEQNSEFNLDNVTLDQYLVLTDKFLPKPIAEFVKMQIGLANKKAKGRLHRLQFRQS